MWLYHKHVTFTVLCLPWSNTFIRNKTEKVNTRGFGGGGEWLEGKGGKLKIIVMTFNIQKSTVNCFKMYNLFLKEQGLYKISNMEIKYTINLFKTQLLLK